MAMLHEVVSSKRSRCWAVPCVCAATMLGVVTLTASRAFAAARVGAKFRAQPSSRVLAAKLPQVQPEATLGRSAVEFRGPAIIGAASAAALAAAAARRHQQRCPSALAAAAESSEKQAADAAPPKPKKVRITAFDSIRFFLITYIVCGHFIAFAQPSPFATRAITQINVVVGAFFALSGYVAAYTTTENAERKADPRLLNTPAPRWILQRVFGYYPLHFLVLLLFAPMFIFSDASFGGLPQAIGHGLMAFTMTQAWFPMHAEVWNAPTWFLSALTFAMACLPFALPRLAEQNKPQLRRSAFFLFLAGLLPKLGYCYDNNAWGLLEGAMSPKAMHNLAIFNTQRFNPFYALIEVLLGVVACRLVMLDGTEGEEAPKPSALATAFPVVGMIAVIIARAYGIVQISDLLTRAVIFIPLFLMFLMAAHRASVQPKVTDPLVNLLSSKLLVTLGSLAFPIFVVHGPLGQLFYKKLVATKLWGGPLNIVCGPWFFYVYLGIVLASAWVLQKTFVTNKGVGAFSKSIVGKLSAPLEA